MDRTGKVIFQVAHTLGSGGTTHHEDNDRQCSEPPAEAQLTRSQYCSPGSLTLCPLHPPTQCPGRPPLLPSQYWVPRIQLLFSAEDPRVFTQRVVEANALRKNTEALLLYNLYVDCMPTEGRWVINEQSMNNIKQWAMSTPRMRKGPR